MRCMRLLICVFLLCVLAGTGLAATLHGTIYDIELNELNDVVVAVDSSPPQRFVSKDGEYSFVLQPGEYTLTATWSPNYRNYTTSEKVVIKQDGDFVFDLFIFPGLDVQDEEYLSEDVGFDIPEEVVEDSSGVSGLTIAIIVVAAIIILLIIYYLVGQFKHKAEESEMKDVEKLEKKARAEREVEKKEVTAHKPKHREEKLDDELQKVLDVIHSEDGRTTQKELRKQIPLSEAKISLMVSELEHKGLVKKVKKGRGNIIILKKK